jgi:hypothetical protein
MLGRRMAVVVVAQGGTRAVLCLGTLFSARVGPATAAEPPCCQAQPYRLLTPIPAAATVIAVKCTAAWSVLTSATMDVKKKYEIEAALATEAQAISAGQLKEENPLDLSDDFRAFCEACRRGDLKVCQEKISEGVNINARDKFDYTPLILVCPSTFEQPQGTDRRL